MLDSLRARLLRRLPLLNKLADNLALLDMLCAFAKAVRSSGKEYVRPRCTERGPIAILKGRHPLLEQQEAAEFQPNDTYLAECSSLYVIGGPNMSGKSTYLRQASALSRMAAYHGTNSPRRQKGGAVSSIAHLSLKSSLHLESSSTHVDSCL